MTIIPVTMDFNKDSKPRQMVFSKMERLIKDMQRSNTGIPVRNQKMLLTTIPYAFTGYDLVDWLMKRLDIDDLDEALHLSSLFCQHGYFFPITDTKILSVKEDSSLYRFQCPYYWPSKNMHPNNMDYAIHLTKRSLRNKQKHGLEEYEQIAKQKLKSILCDRWECIHVQAEQQVRVAKQKKKIDKIILDSQEKAFWRIHRPPPGQVKCIEEGFKKYFLLSQIARKKKRKEFLKKKVAYLTQALEKPRMKMSKALESYVNRFEQYCEYDAFLSTPQPSNAWITGDTTMWEISSENVEILTEPRVRKWAFGLHELLSDEAGKFEFEAFLKKEFSHENIRFWTACMELKSCPQSQVARKVNSIYREFLSLEATCEINIDGKTMVEVMENIKNPTRYTFEAAENHIYSLMRKDSYARFMRSEKYKFLLANAIQPCSKKRFFSFGANKKKVPTTPSPQPKRRGSTSSDQSEIGGGSACTPQHSYSMGNLREIGEQQSSVTLNSGTSPGAVRKLFSRPNSRPKKCLEVPTQYHSQFQDPVKTEPTTCLALAVPTTKLNVVAPWEEPD